MIKHYYTYADLTELLACSKKTLERKIPQMNIQKRYFHGGKPYFLVLDVHAYLMFNKNWRACTQIEKREIQEMLNYV
jgi:hypothetical protein|tara:strand:+ start:300 stop:530 length:231 start_codon:yes stop_codon:yes gene_type:complete